MTPKPLKCMNCKKHIPFHSNYFTVRRNVETMDTWRTESVMVGHLCQDCGRAVSKHE